MDVRSYILPTILVGGNVILHPGPGGGTGRVGTGGLLIQRGSEVPVVVLRTGGWLYSDLGQWQTTLPSSRTASGTM